MDHLQVPANPSACLPACLPARLWYASIFPPITLGIGAPGGILMSYCVTLRLRTAEVLMMSLFVCSLCSLIGLHGR